MRKKYLLLILTSILCFVCVLLPKEEVVSYGFIFYAVQFTSIFYFLLKENKNYIYFFSPSFICIIYLGLNYILGHYVVSRGISLNLKYFYAFHGYKSISFITIFFLLCNFFVFAAIPFRNMAIVNRIVYVNTQNISYKILYGLTILAFIFGFVEIDLSFLGGVGDFSYAFKLGLIIIIVFLLSSKKGKHKYVLYLLIILSLIPHHYDNKREILYVILLILFFEFLRNQITIQIKIRQLVILACGLFFVVYIVILASIMRGYGNYNVDSPVVASKYTYDYVRSDYALPALVANFELASVYGNSSNAVDYVYRGDVGLLYGSTFIKFIFLPIPKSVFSEKPASMIDIYTKKFDPKFRDIGGSYPISIYSEVFWNFGVLSLPFLYGLFFMFNKLYLVMIRHIKNARFTLYSYFLLYMYITIIQFIRGSGFEIWLVYCLITLPFAFVVLQLINGRTRCGEYS